MLVRSALKGPPAPACKLALAGTPSQPGYAPLQFLFESGQIINTMLTVIQMNLQCTLLVVGSWTHSELLMQFFGAS